jgi:hypothetical protein
MNRSALFVPVAVFFHASLAAAHPGPRVWLSVDNGKIVTYSGAYPPGDPANYQPSRVFTQMLADIEDDTWETDFPGYQKVPGGMIPAETTFSYNITGPLLWFNDSGGSPFFETVAEHFGGSPPIPQMAVTNEVFQTKVTSSGFVAGNSAFTFTGDDDDHAHLAYTLLGNGLVVGGGPDGVYALQLQLTATGVTSSDTYYLILGKNASAADLAAAADAILPPASVPAASGWSLIAFALAILAAATIAIRTRFQGARSL